MTLALALTALLGLVPGAPESVSSTAGLPLPETAPARTTAKSEPTYEVVERHGFILGGPSGSYTDWKRYDLPYFDGLSTTIKIGDVYSKQTDVYAPIARISVIGDAPDGKNRPFLSVRFRVDLETKRRLVYIDRPDKDPMGVDFELPADQKIELAMTAVEPGKLHVAVDNFEFDVPYDFKITGLRVLGSGLDVEFDPFAILRRREPQ